MVVQKNLLFAIGAVLISQNIDQVEATEFYKNWKLSMLALFESLQLSPQLQNINILDPLKIRFTNDKFVNFNYNFSSYWKISSNKVSTNLKYTE